MNRKVRFRPAARADMRRLYLYIADQASPTTAQAYIGRIRAACEKLDFMPRRGQPRDDLGPGIRTLPFEGRATIAYLVDDIGVQIARVFPAGMDYSSDDFSDRS
jgi:toxin ParE1/3/4